MGCVSLTLSIPCKVDKLIELLGGFAIDRLQDIQWSDEPFNFLVLGQKQKMLISALVRQHVTNNSQSFDDVIKGKGRGLIGLLSGKPGCGKTMTAEAIAEKTRRPLYVPGNFALFSSLLIVCYLDCQCG